LSKHLFLLCNALSVTDHLNHSIGLQALKSATEGDKAMELGQKAREKVCLACLEVGGRVEKD
jgi:hypothetical protein